MPKNIDTLQNWIDFNCASWVFVDGLDSCKISISELRPIFDTLFEKISDIKYTNGVVTLIIFPF